MKFHERFDVQIDFDEARQRFVNRTHTLIFSRTSGFMRDFYITSAYSKIVGEVSAALGLYYQQSDIGPYVGNDFLRCLQALEALYHAFGMYFQEWQADLAKMISRVLVQSEVDLGIEFANGIFTRKGAPELDQSLINQPLKWLRERQMDTVVAPLEKALGDFLRIELDKSQYADVVTDAYEALEALAKLVCENDRDLSKNAELFLSKLRVSSDYREILKSYIKYANNFRHAVSAGSGKPALESPETEAFLYMTGWFIRLAITAGWGDAEE